MRHGVVSGICCSGFLRRCRDHKQRTVCKHLRRNLVCDHFHLDVLCSRNRRKVSDVTAIVTGHIIVVMGSVDDNLCHHLRCRVA